MGGPAPGVRDERGCTVTPEKLRLLDGGELRPRASQARHGRPGMRCARVRCGGDIEGASRERATSHPSRAAVEVKRGHRELQLLLGERVAQALAQPLEPGWGSG